MTLPLSELVRIYGQWGKGGSGLILSGHIMIDPKAMAAPDDVLLAADIGDFNELQCCEWISASLRLQS